MSDKPILLFLHGVGGGDPEQIWQSSLDSTLTKIGYPDLSGVKVVAPRYADSLREAGDPQRLPPIVIKALSGADAKRNRRDFELRISGMERRLGWNTGGNETPWARAVVDQAITLPWFQQAHNYLHTQGVRAEVLNRILRQLPDTGRVVILGHSLGSVIAVDLLRRLSPGLEVAGLVTIGSPLSNANFTLEKLRRDLEHPPMNLSWWVNFWSATDPVAALRGVSSVFPWMLDRKVQTPLEPNAAHAAREYLVATPVAEAIGFGLYGSQSTDLVVAIRDVEVGLDSHEFAGIQALRYAHLIRADLKDEQFTKYSGALRQVQSTVIADMKTRARQEGRPIAGQIERLDVDGFDLTQDLPVPEPVGYLDKEHAAVRLMALATQNPIHPFEIEVSQKSQKKAMRELTAEMGLGSQFGTDIFEALEEAGKALPGARKNNWFKWGILGVAAVTLAVGTGGLALAAGPALTGAAAITSALASFGPGGMIGGLLTAGTLVSAGGGGIAIGVLSPATTSESVEALVQSQVAVVILRDKHHLDPDHLIWMNLREMEVVLTRERQRLAEFSDDKAVAVKELNQKLQAVSAALKYLEDKGLHPIVFNGNFDGENALGELSRPRMLSR